jgi:hypothetical protein
MFGEDELLNWIKRKGPFGSYLIAIMVILAIVYIAIFGTAQILTSIDVIKEHLNPLKNNSESNTIHLIDNEIPGGTPPNLSLAHTPNPPNSLNLFMNGMLLKVGSGNDYTLSGKSIKILYPGVSEVDQFLASYRY